MKSPFFTKEDKSALVRLLKTPLLILMIPILLIIMVVGIVTGFFKNLFSKSSRSPSTFTEEHNSKTE